MEKNAAWTSDERHREQLAIVVRDDLLSLSRFVIQSRKKREEEEKKEGEGRKGETAGGLGERPRTTPVGSRAPTSSLLLGPSDRGGTDDDEEEEEEKIGRRVALESKENVNGAKSILKRALAYLDSADVRFAVAERLLEIEDTAELDLRLGLSGLNPRASFVARKVKKKKEKGVEEFIKRIQSSDEANFLDHQGIFTLRDILPFFAPSPSLSPPNPSSSSSSSPSSSSPSSSSPLRSPSSSNRRRLNVASAQAVDEVSLSPDGPFILKMYALVASQAEPEEAIVDVLDKALMLLGARQSAFPPKLVQSSPKKQEFVRILRNAASENTVLDVVSAIGKARDSSRPYTAGPIKSMRTLFNTDQFVLAAAKGDHDKLQEMLGAGQPVDDFSSTFHYGALHAAADFGMPECVEVLIEGGATVNIRNKMTGKTPLHYAAESRRFAVCQQLLDAGASKRTRDSNGLKPLYYGTEVQEEESLIKARLLRDAPGRIMHVDFVSTSSKAQLAEITIDWSEPKNLGYDLDPIDHHRILWRAIQPRCVNPLYCEFLRLLDEAEVEEDFDPAEHDWVHEDSVDKPFSIRDVKPAEDYEVSIRAHSDGGYSPESREVLHTSASSVPSTPGRPVFMTSTSTAVTVAWLPPKFENGSPVTSYQVSRKILIGFGEGHGREHKEEGKGKEGKGGGKGKGEGKGKEKEKEEEQREEQWVAVQSIGSSPVATVRSIPQGGYVQIKVRARSADGFSMTGDIGGPFQALDPIRVLDRSPNHLKIIWQTVPAKPVLHFELQARIYGLILSEDDYKVVADDVPQNLEGITYEVRDLLPGTDYQFRIRAFIDKEGWQAWADGLVSNHFKTVDTEPDPPTQPYDQIGASSATAIVLWWEAGPCNGKAISAFEVYWKSTVKDWELLSEVKGQPTLAVNNLVTGQSYVFKVRARNEIGWGEWSTDSKSVSTNPIPIPGVPTCLKTGIGWVGLEWNKPVGELLVDSYEIQKRIISADQLEFAKWEVVVTTCQTNDYLVQELKPCAKYNFRVRALTFDGWSSFSPISGEFECKRRH